MYQRAIDQLDQRVAAPKPRHDHTSHIETAIDHDEQTIQVESQATVESGSSVASNWLRRPWVDTGQFDPEQKQHPQVSSPSNDQPAGERHLSRSPQMIELEH